MGQEVLTGLPSNPRLAGVEKITEKAKGVSDVPVNLPFFDDFSGESVIPSPDLWSDDYAFINNTYSDRQLTLGVATLDALDNKGKLYETANPEGFEADHLTSQPINLNYQASDNIWLSFYYQPGGLGDPPEPRDSLTLHFYAPEEDKWYSVWRTPGTMEEKFIPVIIHIQNPRYLKNGFRFRFVNWASLADFDDPSMIGNCDHWNLDYVYLDRNRNSADTALADVAFRTPLRSVLKTHEAMPWKHFRMAHLQEMGPFITIHYRNNDKITRNVTRNFEIRDMFTKAITHSFSAGASNIEPFTNVDYNANLLYTFNNNNPDSAVFKITCSLKTDQFDPKSNDTITYYQVFKNYFAYDDGTSEAGYGINGQGSRNAMVACRFKSYLQDTLRAISICFNDSYMGSNRRSFDLMVWDDLNGLPGDVIYSAENMTVESGEEVNGFRTYILPDGVPLNGIFYVGWRQRTETFLNAGFDVNTPGRGRQYYWLNGYWNQSQKDGTIMIRPVMGPALKTTSSDDRTTRIETNFRVWPNPATDHVNISCGELLITGSAFISVFDIQGREVMKVPFTERLEISNLKPGVYNLIPFDGSRRVGYFRLIKIR